MVSPPLPAFVNNRKTTSKLFSLSEFHTFTPSLTNEFRFGYNRYNDDIPAGNYPFPGLDAFPEILIKATRSTRKSVRSTGRRRARS